MGIDLPETTYETIIKHSPTNKNAPPETTKHPAIDLLLKFKEVEKNFNSFGLKFLTMINPITGRLHPSLWQMGTHTGRFAASDPNTQQIPGVAEVDPNAEPDPYAVDFRSAFIAPEGKVLIACDYSQMELRLIAQASMEQTFIQAFIQGLDTHKATASTMFGIPFEQVTKTLRSIAKTINFGLAYGMGAQGLSVRINKTVQESEELIKQFFAKLPDMKIFLEEAASKGVKLGYAETTMGRKRFFQVPNKPAKNAAWEVVKEYRKQITSIQRQATNHPIQGDNADVTKIALVWIYEALRDIPEAYAINTVHDEIIVECLEENAEKVTELVKNCMEEAGRLVLKDLPCKAEPAIGKFWKH